MGLVEVVVVTGLCGIAALLVGSAALWVHPWFGLLFFLLFALWTFLVTFFRDPTRTIPTAADVLVSPADGTVTHIDDSADADFPGGKAVRISIFLSIFNVHVNRAPRAGRVVEVRYFPGEFLDARHPRCGVANEQLWIDLDDSASGRRLRIKQISGKLARRIVCWLKPGDLVQRGERFGMIKFGSRTEVCVPADLVAAVQVKVGDKVKGGSTVLVRLAVSTLV
jgi:phosphatidylserine decarboxylase